MGILASATAAILVVAAFVLVPLSHAFSGAIFTSPAGFSGRDVGTAGQSFPTGASVHLDWRSAGAPVDFFGAPSVVSPDIVCNENGTGGSCGFVATSGDYVFLARDRSGPTEVTFEGTFSHPAI